MASPDRDPDPQTTPARTPARSKLRPLDALTIAAVAVVVLLVSRPRLRDFALRENETDAFRLLQRLGLAVDDVHAGERPSSLGELVDSRPDLRRYLGDAKVQEEGARFLRHGYLFELVTGPDGTTALRAWPASHGDTGWAAFLRLDEADVLGHPNGEANWSGPQHPPGVPWEGPAGPGWRTVRELDRP